MFGRRRDIPPYEIMRPGGREARQKPASAWRSPRRADEAPAGEGPVSFGDWLAGGEPVVLRLPKGVALLIAVGVLLLILVAYWVGHARGGAAADSRHRQQIESMQTTRASGPIPLLDEGRSKQPPPNDAQPAGSPRDPRLPGLNYLLLAWYPEQEARRLASFLSERGVETFITTSNNARLFYVIGAQGFEQPRSGPGKTYEDQLRRLGREWKAHNGNRGEDLSTMWWKLHEQTEPSE